MMFKRVFSLFIESNAVSLEKINLAGQSSCGAVLPFMFYSVSFLYSSSLMSCQLYTRVLLWYTQMSTKRAINKKIIIKELKVRPKIFKVFILGILTVCPR